MSIGGWLLAAPGPLPGRSWGSPGPLLTPLGSLLGSLGALRGWFCELLALLLQTPSENRGNLVFADSSTLFNVFSWFWGPRILPKSSKIAPRSFLGTELAAKVCQKWLGKPLGDQKRDLEGCLEPFGPPRGRQGPAAGALLGSARSAGEG